MSSPKDCIESIVKTPFRLPQPGRKQTITQSDEGGQNQIIMSNGKTCYYIIITTEVKINTSNKVLDLMRIHSK